MRRAVLFGCFFLSGAAGLIDEVCWIRRASLVFGSTVFALSSVVAVFFLGLAIGSWIFGRLSLRMSRPLLWYAGLEIGLAVLVLVSPFAFDVAEGVYGRIYRASAGAAGASWARIAIVGAVILPPTILMGGTLPLFCRQFVQGPARIARGVGFLYGLNTLGAAVGCAAAGFLLIPALGVQRTLLVAALLSLAAGGAAAVVRAPAVPPAPTLVRRTPAADAGRAAIVAMLFFGTGFVAVGHEVVWTRFLSLLVRTSVHTYTLSLTVVLAGIVLGSWIMSTFPDRVARSPRTFAALQLLGALAMLSTMLLPPRAWQVLHSEIWTCFALALGPAALSGAAFPVAVRMVAHDAARIGAVTGSLSAANTLGGITGSLLVGFVALPHLGLQRSVLLTTGIGMLTGFAAWWALDGRSRTARVAIAMAACAGMWIAIPRLLQTRLPADFLAERQALVDYREGLQSNLAVVRKARALQLEADRWWQGQDRKTHQIMAAHLPMLLHAAPRRVLVVGVGAGQTPERILLHDVERMDCVDIEPAVFDLVRKHFPSAWMRDPRVRLMHEDGRSYISHTAARYDVIALEVGQIFRPGVEAFYTADFYARAHERLAPGGILSQFVPLAFLRPEAFSQVVASFLHVFPQSVLWYNTSELLLVGTNAARIDIDPQGLSRLEGDPAVRADLSWSHWGGNKYWLNQPHVFLGGFLCGPNGLAALAAGRRLLRDDRPELGLGARRANAVEANELPILEVLRPRLEPVAAILQRPVADSTLAAAAAVRDRNLGDMVASALLRRAEVLRAPEHHSELEAVLSEALHANPESVQANRLWADFMLLRGRPEEARVSYERALALHPDDAASNIGMALLLHTQRRFTEAVAHYRRGLEQDPNDAEALSNLAGALMQSGDLAGAERHFEAALRLRPDLAQARQYLAQLQQVRSRSNAAPSTRSP